MPLSTMSASTDSDQFGGGPVAGDHRATVRRPARRAAGRRASDSGRRDGRRPARASNSGCAPPAASPTTSNASGWAAMTSSAWVPIDPVEPSMTIRRRPVHGRAADAEPGRARASPASLSGDHPQPVVTTPDRDPSANRGTALSVEPVDRTSGADRDAHTGVMATRNTLSTRWVTVIMVVALVCSVVVVWGLIQITGQSPASSSTPSASDPRAVGIGVARTDAVAARRPPRRRRRPDSDRRPAYGYGPGGTDLHDRLTPAPLLPGLRAAAAGGLDRYRGDDDHRARPVRGHRRNVVLHPDRRPGPAGPGGRAPARSTIPTRCR